MPLSHLSVAKRRRFCILLIDEHREPLRPCDCQLEIIPANRCLAVLGVLIRGFIKKVRVVLERYKATGKPFWNPQHPVIDGAELNTHMLPKGR